MFVHPFRALRVIAGRDRRVTMAGVRGKELEEVPIGLLALLLRVAFGEAPIDLRSDVSCVTAEAPGRR
jgi:hypothetical protein